MTESAHVVSVPEGQGSHPRCGGLPAQRIDTTGRAQVDLRVVFALAVPLIANSALQIVLNLTDTWFVGRLSTHAIAAIGAVHWLVAVVILLLGSIAMAVQTMVAQSYGARRFTRSSQAVWIALWGLLFMTPFFVAIGFGGKWLLQLFGLSPQLQDLGAQFWLPRVVGSPFGVAAMAVLGFFNGIGRPRVVLLTTLIMVASNVVLNQVFIFDFGWGIAGSAWASTVAQALGLTAVLGIFLSRSYRDQYRSHLSWRVSPFQVMRQFGLGFAMSVLSVADLLAVALFQIMQVQVSSTAGAVTQITMMLTSIAYIPGAGIALAGTTLVGQSIGAGDRHWAMHVGTRVIALAAVYMGGMGLLLALAGPWLLPNFISANDPQSTVVVASAVQILWLAAIYQFFDGLNIGSSCCLRAVGDATVPAALVLVLAWLVFVPLVHAFTFPRGQGWMTSLPHFGWELIGGWSAMVIYVMLLGTTLFVRWRSGSWKRKPL